MRELESTMIVLLRKGVEIVEIDWRKAQEIVTRQMKPLTKRQKKTRLEIGLVEDPDEKKETKPL